MKTLREGELLNLGAQVSFKFSDGSLVTGSIDLKGTQVNMIIDKPDNTYILRAIERLEKDREALLVQLKHAKSKPSYSTIKIAIDEVIDMLK